MADQMAAFLDALIAKILREDLFDELQSFDKAREHHHRFDRLECCN